MLAAVGLKSRFALVHLSLQSEQGDCDGTSDAEAGDELERFHYSHPFARAATAPYQIAAIAAP
ncbi:hypothetical protein P5W99_24565 [Paraburkholderia sp. A3BS-1L]|uniref:hypothetical protein n=1 Tax=Paraburkholderia sp. A3BS-1L TaxID=3028375 RepID=UPI003DA9EC3C